MTSRTRRTGFTLFELMLVMAVMVITAALSFPSLRNMFGAHKLTAAIDAVRGGWSEARARAINEGRPYRFSVEPGGSHFRVAPDSAIYWPNSTPSNDPDGKGYILEQALPTGVRFAVGDAPPAAAGAQEPTKEDSKPSGNWSTAVVFLPDGTARDDVKISFQLRGVRPKAIVLRGLTGNVTVQNADEPTRK
jgi:prepilin-type N-terminal cleavage/methylation domain-containing protein